eukprot:1296911-Rhodomonas_salina.1
MSRLDPPLKHSVGYAQQSFRTSDCLACCVCRYFPLIKMVPDLDSHPHADDRHSEAAAVGQGDEPRAARTL